ncbi:MAG TPA: response regulator [Verrucomicrobiae bacterium]|nr:response regulator [Verrucomicrobiae bacterium]
MNKILLIEDDQLVANIYRNKLVVAGFQVEVANDGESGYELIHSFRPDAVLLDLMLPRLPGIDLIRKVRAESDFAHLPMLVFTSTYLTSMVQEAWKAGATKCLAKSSCTPAQVIDTLKSILNITPEKPEPAPAPAQAQAIPASTFTANSSDADFQAELQAEFRADFPAAISTLRNQLQGLIKLTDESTRAQQLQQMYRRVHGFTGNAAIVGLPQIAQLSDALEILIKELQEKPKTINASTLRTVASAIDCLAVIFDSHETAANDLSAVRILVVDDEIISRRAVTHALDKAKLKSVNIENPLKAFDLLLETRFDLIFLDVDMPHMNGYELCSKIRMLDTYKKTPIVFVTSLNDFEARANSTMSGGNDFIAKPFLFIELAVKALIHILRNQTQPRGR